MKQTVLFLVLTFLLSTFAFSQASIIVTDGSDAGAGTLRQAILDLDDGGIITFSPTVTTVVLTSDRIDIDKNLTIDGGDGVTITRSGTNEFRCFRIDEFNTQYTVNLFNLTFTNFKQYDGSSSTNTKGGVILFDCTGGYLNIINCAFMQNHAGNGLTKTSAGEGGAIYISTDNLYVENCFFSENYAGNGLVNDIDDGGSGADGGAIASWGANITIIGTNFVNNEAGSGGSSSFDDGGNGGNGGAMYIRGVNLQMSDCTFESNFAGNGGDAINDGGDGGVGGAIYSYTCDTFNLEDVDFFYNFSGGGGNGTNYTGGNSGEGGAFFIHADLCNLNNCIFAENGTATAGTGSNVSGTTGDGGALYVNNTKSNLLHCTFSENNTMGNIKNTGEGGAIKFYLGSANLNRCYFADNFTGTSSAGNSGYGGAIYIRNDSTNISNSLIFNNYTGDGLNYSGYGGGIYTYGSTPLYMANNVVVKNNTGSANHSGDGGGICIGTEGLHLSNTIITDNFLGTGGTPEGNDIYCYYDVLTQNSLIGNTLNSGVIGLNNIFDTDPMFADFANNDFNLLAGSPCLNAGFPDTTGFHMGDFDFEGNARIVGQIIDMGAYEYQNGIITGIVNDSPFIISNDYSADITIPYTIEGTFESNNIFTAILSDENGSFDNSQFIGNIASNTNGEIEGNIPAGTISGTAYRIKVYGSNPNIYDGGDNGTDLEIILTSNPVSPEEDQSIIISNDGTELTVNETPVANSREWKFSTTSGSGYISFLVPETETTYTPNFETEGTFYVICESFYDDFSIISNEIEITVVDITLYTVNFEVTGGNGGLSASVDGTDIISGQEEEEGKNVVFTAEPDANYEVFEWKVNDESQSETGNIFTYNNLTENINVTVEFQVIESIEDLTNNGILIYPNPTSGKFSILSPNSSIEEITITNLTGKTIYFSKINSNKLNIDISEQPIGIYFIVIKQNEEMLFEKILKN
ncbi:MAG: T9SS type A sorting domain-containing protein [Bacteroidales bacterium]|nr:T9SS type A sorting domain-containing protein [Bacteroidales bacterium]